VHLVVAVLAAAYLPRRPTETVLYGLVRENLRSFLAHAREHYEGGLPRYVESELRAYLKCGVFAEGFTRAHCGSCGHDLLVAFSCKSRSACPSCAGRRMANTGAAIMDRVLPDVPVRQYVLSLPHELRRLAARTADVLTALGRIFVDAVFARYRGRAKDEGVADAQCGAINFVQRFGSSVNLHVHFHLVVIDGVFTRDAQGGVRFHPARPPLREELEAVVQRVETRATAWLRRRGHLDERPLEARSNEASVQTAMDACVSIAMGRGQTAAMPSADEPANERGPAPARPSEAVDRDGYNLHASVRIDAGDDAGREKLCRYAARPPLSLGRLRRLPDGRFTYRLKYVSGGRAKHRIMTGLELMARLAALIAPPRYPLVRYAGVLGPRSAWRKDVVPRPRVRGPACDGAARTASETAPRGGRQVARDAGEAHSQQARHTESAHRRPEPMTVDSDRAVNLVPVVVALAPNVLSVRHWDRLRGGLLYAATSRVDWARLLRRTFDVDVLQCAKCGGRLRVLAVLTEAEPVARVLAHLGLPTEAPSVARARDPTDDGDESGGQLELGLA
jgi:hypothetical protein